MDIAYFLLVPDNNKGRAYISALISAVTRTK
jgi:hypothetical protein